MLFDWDPAAVEELLQRMTPAASQVYLCSSLFRNGAHSDAEDGSEVDEEDEDEDDDDDDDGDDDDDEDDEDEDDEGDEKGSADDNQQRDELIQQIRTQYVGPAKWASFTEMPDMKHAKTETRFGTNYWQQKRPKDVLAAWQAPPSSSVFPQPPVPFALPAKNPFVTSNFALLPHYGLSGQDMSDVSLVQEKCEPVPDIIVKSSGLTIWHM